MTQEDKQLLLKDICARLPYGLTFRSYHNEGGVEGKGTFDFQIDNDTTLGKLKFLCGLDNCRPYLRPMSSMTDEEKKEAGKLGICYDGAFHNDIYDVGTSMEEAFLAISWLLERHFDINHLIEKGLAIEAKPEMYKI